MGTFIFFAVLVLLLFFLFIYLPWKHSQHEALYVEMLEPVPEEAQNAAQLCEELHHPVWYGVNPTLIDQFGFMYLCPVCERFRNEL